MSSLVKDPEPIRKMFDSIASRYDQLNGLLSLGLHHRWQKSATALTNLQPGQAALDVCCGTGCITQALAEKVGTAGRVIGLDISGQMLKKAGDRLYPKYANRIRLIQCDAQQLPFGAATFHCAIIGYGLRNVPDPQRVLGEMQRVVKAGGKIVVLEMAQPKTLWFKSLYRLYLAHIVPGWGRLIAHNQPAYEYLHQSILEFSLPEEVTALLVQLKMKDVKCYLLCGGIVTIHVGTVN